MKRLCCGTFLTVLTLCKAQGVTQKSLCGIILESVNCNYNIKGQDDVISHVVRCEHNLSDEVIQPSHTIETDVVSNCFKAEVVPILDANKQKLVVLTLKDILKSDTTISDDTFIDKTREISKKTLLDKKDIFLPDFLADIFLFTVLNTKNRDGKSSRKEIDADYISSFDSRKNEITLLTNRSNYMMEFANEITPNPKLLMALDSESGGKCQKCGRPLGVYKNGRYIYYGQLVDLAPAGAKNCGDEALATLGAYCVKCAREIQDAGVDEKKELLAIKQDMQKMVSALESLSEIPLEQQIEDVLREVEKIEDPGDTNQRFEPLKLDRKITQPVLKVKARAYMNVLFYPVQNVFDRLSGENKLNPDKFGRSIRRMYEDVCGELTSQSKIFEALVQHLYDSVGKRNREACEIIISYFIQGCEVFDEVT